MELITHTELNGLLDGLHTTVLLPSGVNTDRTK